MQISSALPDSEEGEVRYPLPKAPGKPTGLPPLEWLSEIPCDHRIQFGFGFGHRDLADFRYSHRDLTDFRYGRSVRPSGGPIHPPDPIPNPTSDWTNLSRDTKVRTDNLRKVIEEFKASSEESMLAHTNIFVRDIDCNGHNRLYQFRVVNEYDDDYKNDHVLVENQATLMSTAEDHNEIDELTETMMEVPDYFVGSDSFSKPSPWNRIM